MARMGAEPVCRYAAAARRRRKNPGLVCRPCELADPDRGTEYPGRPGLVGTRLATRLRRAETSQRSRHRVRQIATDRYRAGVARPLRSSGCRDAVEACRKILAA